jgi:hypothetical protein
VVGEVIVSDAEPNYTPQEQEVQTCDDWWSTPSQQEQQQERDVQQLVNMTAYESRVSIGG